MDFTISPTKALPRDIMKSSNRFCMMSSMLAFGSVPILLSFVSRISSSLSDWLGIGCCAAVLRSAPPFPSSPRGERDWLRDCWRSGDSALPFASLSETFFALRCLSLCSARPRSACSRR